MASVSSPQGNGHERDFMGDKRVYIMDVYNRHIYPGDRFAKRKPPPQEPRESPEGILTWMDSPLSISCALGSVEVPSFILRIPAWGLFSLDRQGKSDLENLTHPRLHKPVQ